MKPYFALGLLCLAAITAPDIAELNPVEHLLAYVPQAEHHRMFLPDQIEWKKSGGSEFAVLAGDPAKEGSSFVLRLKFADGAKIPPHWHPIDENITVISGTFFMGAGEKFDESKAHEMKAGSYGLMPKETRHFAWVKGETVIQIHGVGQFKTFWVNVPEKAAKQGE